MSSDSSDDEEKLRKRTYLAELDDEDHQPPIEEKAYSKATRRSIDGFAPRNLKRQSSDESSDEDSDDIIVEDDETSDVHSSTIRSPLRDVSANNRSSISHESFNTSIETKMSSTISVKDGSELLDEAAGGVRFDKIKVSPSMYEAVVAAKEKLEQQIFSLVQAMEVSINLRDGGEVTKIRIDTLMDEVDEKNKLLQTWEVEENIRLQDNQESIEARPAETDLGTPPKHLEVTLMNHQLQALRFMMWREKQNPRGGILADDMGLGKSLTTISLILRGLQADDESEDENDSQDKGSKSRGRKDLRDGGKLTVY